MSEVVASSARPVMGWYPNPDGDPALHRWWNGSAWSDLLWGEKFEHGSMVVTNPAGQRISKTLAQAVQETLSGTDEALPWLVVQPKRFLSSATPSKGVAITAVLDAVDERGMTSELESRINVVFDRMGIEAADLSVQDREHITVAWIAAGKVPTDGDPAGLLLKAGEVCHGSSNVSLLKETVMREFRGGSAGISIPVGHTGIRLRTGQFRGRSVVTGTKWTPADTGALVITNRRVVFVGSRKSLEFAYPKLLSLDVSGDVIRMAVSNRQTPSLFKFPAGTHPKVAAALISYASAS